MKMKLALNEGATFIELEVTFSQRRTLAIKIDPTGKVYVAAPQGTSRKVIIEMVNRKADWIIKKLDEFEARNRLFITRQFVDGELFPYLGDEYPLQLSINMQLSKATVKLQAGKFLADTPAVDEAVMRDAMEKWYRAAAAEYIKLRLNHYQSLLTVTPNRITIKAQKTMWGSCSSKGSLNFNWRLMMAPSEVVDYVIVHELCHLIHPNHSKNFWNQVSAILPDYKTRKEWLKKNGACLIW